MNYSRHQQLSLQLSPNVIAPRISLVILLSFPLDWRSVLDVYYVHGIELVSAVHGSGDDFVTDLWTKWLRLPLKIVIDLSCHLSCCHIVFSYLDIISVIWSHVQ